MGSILAACEDLQHAFVLHCESSVLMWAALKKVHVENQTKVNIHYYFEELFTHKYIDGASMPDHIAAMLDIKHCITQAGEDLKDIIVAQAIIISLLKTQTWEFIKISLFEVESLTSKIVCTWLMQEANQQACEKGLDESTLITTDTKAKRSNYKG
jgi:gag-polypeptide of LTR copia-type